MRTTRVNTAYQAKAGQNTGILRTLKNALHRNKLGETLVIKGYISTKDLKSALHQQRETNKPLGKIFLEQSRITKYQLMRLLFRQKAIRLAAATMLCMAAFANMTKKARAATIRDVPARIALVSDTNNDHIQNISHYPKLFGAKEKRSSNLKAFTKWTSMFDRFDRDLNKNSNKHIIHSLQAELSAYKSSSIHAMADKVNDMMNKKKYIVDNKNWGKSDYWATPIEFMTRGGDCEDFAIAKYVALRALGVPESRMRIAIVQDQKKNMPHAVLVVYSERGAMILDNQIKSMRSANSIAHYKPIFSINRTAWWLHTTPTAPTTIVASAAR